jgi:hypothetical protein
MILFAKPLCSQAGVSSGTSLFGNYPSSRTQILASDNKVRRQNL